MPEAVKGRRRYDSGVRREQAQQNRRRVLEAARLLFVERGYAGTTMSGVAERAGVSVETIYKSIGNKPNLLKAVLDVAIVGDDEPVAMVDRDLVRRMREEPDPRTVLRLYGEHIVDSWPRHVPVQLITRAAAAADPVAAELWDTMQAERLRGMRYFARDLADRGFLRPDVTPAEARDVLWALTSPEQYEVLVLQRGWSVRRFGRWISEAMIAALLPAE